MFGIDSSLLVALLASRGVDWSPDPDRLALALLVWQRQAFSYASLIPGFGDAAMARLNLDPRDWDPDARDAYLRRWDPQVLSGSPSSLAALLERVQREGLAFVRVAETRSFAEAARQMRLSRSVLTDLFSAM